MVQIKSNGTEMIRNKEENETKKKQALQVDGKGLTCSTTLLLSKQTHGTNGTNNGESTTGSQIPTEIYHRDKIGRSCLYSKLHSYIKICYHSNHILLNRFILLENIQ